ncbi:hypothetical protein PYW08_002634 [Mythimna loreyi]|uniref:Uncharacterized protein n=1 Tax=Mythimna loreyi TaxID=667449 RepID=A0ACC2QKH7_9NEOP|nr:hypothetical protein PYW08_002634 [Mythimna loreyi]
MYNSDMGIWDVVLETTIILSFLKSNILTIVFIFISFILGTAVGALVTVTIIKSFFVKRSPANTEQVSASRQDTLRMPTNNPTEPTYLNSEVYRNQWVQKIPVEDAPLYAEPAENLFGLPNALASAPPRYI